MSQLGDSSVAPAPTAAAQPSGWLRSAAWDTGLIAYGWVPFYLWLVFGLGLGRDAFGAEPLEANAQRAAIATATLVALAITYVHRHYTFLLIYGDRATFQTRARAYVWVPLGVLAVVATARFVDVRVLGVQPWVAVLFVAGVWNVWHTLQQRYGIGRIYAARAGGTLGTPEHGRRDRLLLFSLAISTAALVIVLRPETFAFHKRAKQVLDVVGSLLEPPIGPVVVAAAVTATLAIAARWLKAELSSGASPRSLVPRWSFLGSTVALLTVFVVHGPIIGYLCFGTAHAIEYIFFVHHFSERKYRAIPEPSFTSMIFGAIRRAPLPIAAFVLVFWLVSPYRHERLYLAYYTSTSLLHFLFDGWIWKVRKPEVRKPLLDAP